MYRAFKEVGVSWKWRHFYIVFVEVNEFVYHDIGSELLNQFPVDVSKS